MAQSRCAATKIVFAPNAFKECLSASAVCRAMQIGVDRAYRSNARFRNMRYETVHVPLADGGDGTLEVLVQNNGGTFKTATVRDALGRAIEAKYGIFRSAADSFQTAVIETGKTLDVWATEIYDTITLI